MNVVISVLSVVLLGHAIKNDVFVCVCLAKFHPKMLCVCVRA